MNDDNINTYIFPSMPGGLLKHGGLGIRHPPANQKVVASNANKTIGEPMCFSSLHGNITALPQELRNFRCSHVTAANRALKSMMRRDACLAVDRMLQMP